MSNLDLLKSETAREFKICIVCGDKKGINEFPWRKDRDTYRNSCYSCESKRRAVYMNKDIEASRERAKRSYLVHKDRFSKRSRDMVVRKDKKYIARYTLRYAIFSGRIKRGACRDCGKPNADAHHEDYSKPLEVVWLCRKHHGITHRKHKYNI